MNLSFYYYFLPVLVASLCGIDGFIPYYHGDNGKFKCVELSPNDYDSGTDLRHLISIEQPQYTKEAAAAIPWTLRQVTKKEENAD